MQNESNFKTFTAENCEKEPIHIPGAIQPHGLLIALRSTDFTILQISANVYDHLGIHADELIHQPLSNLMDLAPVENAAKRLGEKMPRLLNPIPLVITVNGSLKKYDGILHRSGRVVILELEKHVSAEEGYGGFGGFYEAIREVATKLMSAHSLDDCLSIGAEEIKKLTGYSRVLVYKFDEDWNGTVVSESRDHHVASLMHHRFPSTDIPKQARDLYTTNWLRIIPDVNYTPSKIVPELNPITDRPLDLSSSVLRSVSPVHLEYMRNMKQFASMSISLLKDKKLWGLIACHNEEAKFLKFESRVAAEFIGQMVSAQISAREESLMVNHTAQVKLIFSNLLGVKSGLYEAMERLKRTTPQLIALAEARGIALCTPKEVFLAGTTPSESDFEALKQVLHKSTETIFVTNSIASYGEFSREFIKKSAGVLSIKIHDGFEIVWFRPEVTEQIPWSGNPNLSKEKTSDGNLRPRKSFETWLETVEGKSKNWKQNEIEAVEALREGLLRIQVDTLDSEGATVATKFRSALAESMQNTKDTISSREPHPKDVEISSTIQGAAHNSKTLLDGFAEFSVIFMDPNGVIESWTAGATRLLGYNPKQVIGKKIDLFLSDEEVARDKHQRIIDYVAKHHRCEEEMWLYRADRSSFWGKLMIAAVRDHSEHLLGFSIIIQDITKEKSAEEELRATKFAAEAANQAKSAFLANISHEIRTPLGAVLGFAELLAAKNISDYDRENLMSRIQKNGEQLTSLINDLLDLTKVEANKLTVEFIEFDLSSVLSEVLETLSIKASEKSVSLYADIKGQVPQFVVSDPTRLRQILVNLISNAIKFTPEGGNVVVVVSYAERAGMPFIVIRVEDTGRGMTQNQVDSLFQPFVQADASTTRKFGGTGLGLYVSQRLARLLRGDVTIIRSELNKGSVFEIIFDPGTPVHTEKFNILKGAVKHKVLNKLDNIELKNLRILAVDDSADNRHLITLYLEKAGAVVVTAENGEEAVETATQGDFDIVLMDIQMPILDGNSAMRELVKLNYNKPVVALTAHAMIEERENSLRAGFSDYITKPIKRDVLIRTIYDLTHKGKI